MIYLATISVEINRAGRKSNDRYKYFKENQSVEMVYTDGVEKNKESYFYNTLEREIKIRYDKQESFKILNINKIKPLGLNG